MDFSNLMGGDHRSVFDYCYIHKTIVGLLCIGSGLGGWKLIEIACWVGQHVRIV